MYNYSHLFGRLQFGVVAVFFMTPLLLHPKAFTSFTKSVSGNCQILHDLEIYLPNLTAANWICFL